MTKIDEMMQGSLSWVVGEEKPVPKQGIFWLIGGEIVNFTETVDWDTSIVFGVADHQETWRRIRSDHLVDGKSVEYDYFPRGCVKICPVVDGEDQSIIGYECSVYADTCVIEDPAVREKIEKAFDLDPEEHTVKYHCE